ncbi:hypothetical protein ABZW11_14280 [Nonomuraea sp. NPDC004580]|uniref:hypothetical protein n=1 Tax=Nonomuraea sp. NPDC004580 TaxID=3154552 RepID=UPI0033A977A2
MQYERDALIAGLIALAGLLKANPKLPMPVSPVIAYAFPAKGPDDEMCAEVDKIAALLGSGIDPEQLPYGHYQTAIEFGPVRYEFTAILAAARARYAAIDSYRDSIKIDNP